MYFEPYDVLELPACVTVVEKRGKEGWRESHMRAMLPTPEIAARFIAACKMMARDVEDAVCAASGNA